MVFMLSLIKIDIVTYDFSHNSPSYIFFHFILDFHFLNGLNNYASSKPTRKRVSKVVIIINFLNSLHVVLIILDTIADTMYR